MISLQDVERLEERLVVGLMTGTSMDGLDVAVCSIRPGDRLTFDLLAFETVAMPEDLRQATAPDRLADIAAVARINQDLGAYFADALSDVLTPLRCTPHLIGSHGQTVYHENGKTTLQLGEPGILAARFGCPVVHDFRMNDIAVGGVGAPLVPYVDQRLLGHLGEALLVINIGGIANFTALQGNSEPDSGHPSDAILGMDCGPGNMLMDGLAKRWSDGELKADIDGHLAASGEIDQKLLTALKAHPYFASSPPRSTGREQFGDELLDEILVSRPLHEGNGQTVRNLMVTFAELTVWGIVDTYRRFVEPDLPVDRVIVSGGGSRNPVLMAGLEKSFAPAQVQPSDAVGLPVDAKEAIAFAILASDRIDRRTTNLPSVTGAGRHVLLGKITEC
ncbi:MAG: anhydro-N-acetylmuramic acid kinase [Geminicoccaceae bacterium]